MHCPLQEQNENLVMPTTITHKLDCIHKTIICLPRQKERKKKMKNFTMLTTYIHAAKIAHNKIQNFRARQEHLVVQIHVECDV